MKEKIAVSLISSGNLSKPEICKLVWSYTYTEVVEAAFKTGMFEDNEILKMARECDDEYVWRSAFASFKNMDKKRCFQVLKEERGNKKIPFIDVVDTYFKFDQMPAAVAIRTAVDLIALAAEGDGDYIWTRLLGQNGFPKNKAGFSKKQLLSLGQIVDSRSDLEDILKQLLAVKTSNKAILTLTANPKVGKDIIIPILKTGKFKKEMFSLLEKALAGNEHGGGSSTAELLKLYNFPVDEALEFARKINHRGVWEGFQKSYDDYYSLLTESELVYLLDKGLYEHRGIVVHHISQEKLKQLAMTSGSYVVGDIIESGKIDKKTALKAAEKANWYSTWSDLIRSRLFSDYEILHIVTTKVTGHTDHVWQTVCGVIDLSIFSFDKLIEFGEKANNENTWSTITKALRERNKRIKSN